MGQSFCRTREKIFLLDEDFNTSVDKFVEKDSARRLTSLSSMRSPVCTISVQWSGAQNKIARLECRSSNTRHVWGRQKSPGLTIQITWNEVDGERRFVFPIFAARSSLDWTV
jgi:hypothetical protein